MKTIVGTLIVLISGYCYAGLFGPDNHEECIREGLKDAKTKYQIAELRRSCLYSFPDSAPKSAPINTTPFKPVLGSDGLPLCEVIYSGGIRHIKPGEMEVLKKTGQWDFYEILAKGRNVNLGVSKNMGLTESELEGWLNKNLNPYKVISECDIYWSEERVKHIQGR